MGNVPGFYYTLAIRKSEFSRERGIHDSRSEPDLPILIRSIRHDPPTRATRPSPTRTTDRLGATRPTAGYTHAFNPR
jgi:hypothetical protein